MQQNPRIARGFGTWIPRIKKNPELSYNKTCISLICYDISEYVCILFSFILQQLAADEEEEPVAESGRLFLRNLAYTCTEDEIKALFEKYGPIAEVHLPIDRSTKRITGIGFVTFVMPEHAVLAFNEMDGKVFQGRLLHIMPAKTKKTTHEVSINEGMSEVDVSSLNVAS